MRFPAAAAPANAETPDPNRWAALAVLLTGAFLAPLDFFIVNIALPSISADLSATASQVQLVISGYSVVYAVFLITGGRLGDMFGRKTIFMTGLAGFAAASMLCGLATSATMLILARLVQALAAAAMAPQALASVHALFPARERGRALSIYGITIGLASAGGQLLGGALVGADLGGLGWRLVFLINLPVAAIAFLAAIPLLRETRSPQRPRLDLGGMVLASLTLTAFVLPLVEGRERGWPWWSIAMLASTPLFFAWFRRFEIALAARGGEPLVAMAAFETPGLLRGLSAILTLYAMAAFFLSFSIYLQTALDYSAFHAGLAILPFSIGFLGGSTFSPAIGRRLGTAATSFGFILSGSGMIITAGLVAWFPAGQSPPWSLIVPALTLVGIGMGFSIPTMMRAIVERVEPGRAGLVGGLVNTTLQVSASLGVAVLGGLFYTALGDRTDAAAITHAFWLTMLAVAACHLLGAFLATGLGQRRQVRLQTP